MTKSRRILKRFSPTDDAFIKEHFLNITLIQIADHLNRTMGSVAGRCKRLGLKLPEELKKKRLAMTAECINKGKAFRFKKGHAPWNKGKKGLQLGGQVSYFKKGHKPPNTKQDGFISARRHTRSNKIYLYIRIAESKWMELHRYIYQLYHGSIPEGGIVRFKDGNTLNVLPDNLELITKKVNMQRNTIHNLPSDLKEISYLNAQITKFIRKYEKKHGGRA